MKRCVCLLVLVALFLSALPIHSHAVEQKVNIKFFDDGSYIVETIDIIENRASGTKTGTKSQTYYGSAGDSEWKAVLTGVFAYTGSSATCTSSSVNVTIYNSAWYVVSKSASKSGNMANASVTMGEKLLGVTVTKIPTSLSLSCDANGNLS